MDIQDSNPPEFEGFGRWLYRVSALLALIGSVVLVGIVLVSLVSLVGRKLWATPITGDVEIVQALSAPALACFFAYCHLARGDVRVDIVADALGPHWSARLEAFGSLLLGLVGALIAWRTAVGAVSLREVGESSALLAWPIWVSQALVVPGFALQAIAGLYMAVHALRPAPTSGGTA